MDDIALGKVFPHHYEQHHLENHGSQQHSQDDPQHQRIIMHGIMIIGMSIIRTRIHAGLVEDHTICLIFCALAAARRKI